MRGAHNGFYKRLALLEEADMNKLLRAELEPSEFEQEGGRLSKLIELYNFGKVIYKDVETAIKDDLYVLVHEGTQRIAYPNNDEKFGLTWGEGKTYRAKARGWLGWYYSTPGILPFTTTIHNRQVSVDIHYTYAANGFSVKLETVRARNFIDAVGWSLNVEISTRQLADTINPLLGIRAARLLIIAEFFWYGPFQGESNPNAHYEESIIIKGNGESSYANRQWHIKDR